MLERFRRPEYTGENRCLPCTVVNSLLAVALAGVIAGGLVASGTLAAPPAVAVGGLVLAVAAASIYLRGYLVPGTPTLTKRYFPPWLLRLFGKDPTPPGAAGSAVAREDTAAEVSDDADADGTLDVERRLLETGALEPCADRDDLCLTESFGQAWNAAIASVREDGVEAETVVQKLDIDVADCTIEEHGEGRLLRAGSTGEATGGSSPVIGQWPSKAALVADSAAATVLADRADWWAETGPAAKGQVLHGLRLFLTDCPTGEGGVEFDQETVESCCRTHEVVAVTCTETGERLFEQPAPR